MTTELELMMAPCSYMDIEKFQSWLADMSEQGYLLAKAGKVRNTFQFHRISPLKIRYRLTPVSNNLEDWNQRPDTDKQTLAEAFGWDYVCTVGGFHIYRSYNDEDRELNSDPAVLAESLRQVRKKAIISAFAVIFSPVIYLLVIRLLVGAGQFWRFLNRNGIFLFVPFALLYLLTTFKGLYHSVKLMRFFRFLNDRKLPINYKEWKRGQKKFHINTAITYIIGVLLIISISFFRVSSQDSLRFQDHPEDSGSLPFVTIVDLANFSDSESVERIKAGGMVNWTQMFSNVNYEWTEIVDVVSKDGKEGRFSIELSYHEINYGWFADRLADEFIKEAESTGTPLDVELPSNVDLAYFYTDHRGCPTAIIRDGNKVIQVCFPRLDYEDANLNMNTWIERTINIGR